ncbi:LLM class F420-dependent oxidoreductase [Nakamurella silvestris]|nr:LLM class F420-dependent oxidoreductase [Nakamurella silvestris]
MRFGMLTPIVFRPPGQFSPWEIDAGTTELVQVAEVADRLGYHHLTCSEHIALPERLESRGTTYWDPLATLSFLAARTSRIKLATHVLVLGYHHPLAIAKSYGTLDQLSNGRVILGVGVGSLAEEFELLGADFRSRGNVADDTLRAVRTAWGERLPRYHGTRYQFEGFVVDPHATQPSVPIWVGGYSPRSLRRALELGTGWVPFGIEPTRIVEMLGQAEIPAGFEVVLTPAPLDPIGEPQRTLDEIARWGDAGATVQNLVLRHRDLAHCLDQLRAFAELVGLENGGSAV